MARTIEEGTGQVHQGRGILLAAEGFDLDVVSQVVCGIVERYDITAAGISATSLKLEALKKARRGAKGKAEALTLAEAYLATAKAGRDTGDFEDAEDAAKEAGRVARSARNQALAKDATTLAKEITSLKKEFEGVKRAELSLSVNPDDPEANLDVGRFFCFFKEDWKNGLTCLAKGSDEKLKAMAEKELAHPQDAEGHSSSFRV